ncbi:type I-E CRISPR-associated protein Cas6/Cse3/CasE [Kitasatospora sp. NPDC059795]|uniref:type I-E CRISPR-associated protein Cas6/Cse3/CasE n=1 Tax=Kitasatospora sp. NPDC059795 TaxID=3346949 RepID=UPI00365AD89D
MSTALEPRAVGTPADVPTMHLSEIVLDPASRTAWTDLHDRTRLHHRIQSLFPDGYTPRHRVLYRLERRPHGPVLLVQAGLPVNGNALPRHYAARIETRDLTPLLGWATEGRTVRYRIDANPTTARTCAAGAAHRRELRTPLSGADAVEWWARHASAAGLDAKTVTDTRLDSITARRSEHHRPLRLPAVRFEGIADVTDSCDLYTALAHGIGQGKAFGLGLLSLAPVPRP